MPELSKNKSDPTSGRSARTPAVSDDAEGGEDSQNDSDDEDEDEDSGQDLDQLTPGGGETESSEAQTNQSSDLEDEVEDAPGSVADGDVSDEGEKVVDEADDSRHSESDEAAEPSDESELRPGLALFVLSHMFFLILPFPRDYRQRHFTSTDNLCI